MSEMNLIGCLVSLSVGILLSAKGFIDILRKKSRVESDIKGYEAYISFLRSNAWLALPFGIVLGLFSLVYISAGAVGLVTGEEVSDSWFWSLMIPKRLGCIWSLFFGLLMANLSRALILNWKTAFQRTILYWEGRIEVWRRHPRRSVLIRGILIGALGVSLIVTSIVWFIRDLENGG